MMTLALTPGHGPGVGLPSPETRRPTISGSGKLVHHLVCSPPSTLEDLERVITALDQVQRGPLAQPFHHRAQQRQVGELVSVSLEKQHRDPHLRQMLRPLVVGPSRRVQREPEKQQSAHTRKRTRLKSSHSTKSYAGFCLEKKNNKPNN